MNQYTLFTSESVSEGHPDKIADQISDAILDAMLEKDPESRVAVETLIKTGLVLVAGEVRTKSWVDIEDLVREVITDIGYTSSEMGFDGASCAILNAIGKQSSDIAMGVDQNTDDNKEQGAGDQGLMFGYASNETKSLMPAPIHYAHRLMQQQAKVRKDGTLPWLRPDAKSQLTFRYGADGKPLSIDAVVLSTQHSPDIDLESLRAGVMEHIIRPVIPAHWLTEDTKYHINPTGNFVIGGPVGDCGLTGRKIIVDTYGGWAPHGGGAFSGKDPTKVDRSAAYMARWLAKNVVADEMADWCQIQLSYAIGVKEPTSVYIESNGHNRSIEKFIRDNIDLTPLGIIDRFDLFKYNNYSENCVYGHFGNKNVPWEQIGWK